MVIYITISKFSDFDLELNTFINNNAFCSMSCIYIVLGQFIVGYK